MNRIKQILFLVLFLSFVFFKGTFPPTTFAQEQQPQSQIINSSITISDTTKFTITGTVKIENKSSKGLDNAALIVELLQPGKTVEETFDGKKISRISQPLVLTYQKVATLNLKPGQSLEQQFSIRYPATIETGDYLLTAELFDVDSSSHSVTSQKISLVGNGGFLSIDPSSCNIAVGQTNYNPDEGPTVNANEQAIASCVVQNPNSSKVEARMTVPYASFSLSRNQAAGSIEIVNDLVSLNPNQEKRILFNLPNDLSPTVYEGMLQLKDLSGQIISPNIQFRWIIPGESAKIQYFDSNKSYYKKDEIAKISSSILGSADTGWRAEGSHPFSPTAGTDLVGAKALIKITDDQGNLCGETTTELPSTEQKAWDNFTFDVPITRDCNNPTATAQILSSNDIVLDQITKPTTSTDADLKAAGKQTPEEKARTMHWMLVGGIVLLFITIGAVIFFIMKKRRGGPPSPNTPSPNQSTSTTPSIPHPTTTTVGIVLVILATLAVGLTKLEIGSSIEIHSPVKEATAQTTATVKQPINSTSTSVQNVTLNNSYKPKQGGYVPYSNARDFSQKGGDSRVVVAPNCEKIDLEIHASAGSANSCGNWGTGAPVSVFLDGQPITVNNLSSPVRNEIYPVPGMGNNAFDMLQFGGHSGQRYANFYVTPQAQHKTPGEHTLTVRVGASYMVRHDYVEEYASTFENTSNCGVNAPCFVELTHTFSCVEPKQCNEECSNDLECGGQGGCNTCRDNGEGKKTCQPPPACNANCNTNEDCAGNQSNCKVCRPDPTGNKTCQPPAPQCNSACSTDRDCFGGLNGCNSCVEGQCQKPPACGSACTTDATCERSLDTCTQCVSGTCRVPPACGTACTTKADCAGARDGCSECLEGTCTNFNESMCKCDGFDTVQLQYPSNNPFIFDAFAKVEGTDIAKARVESIAFKMSESDPSNPNEGTIIAESQPMTPEVVGTDTSKVRYKATWSMQPPEIKRNKIYRVYSEIKCKPKRITTPVMAASPADDLELYQSRVAGISTANAQGETVIPTPNTGDELQLTTLNFVKEKEKDMCRFVTFEYNEGVAE